MPTGRRHGKEKIRLCEARSAGTRYMLDFAVDGPNDFDDLQASDVDLGAALGEAAKQRVAAYDLPSAVGGWEQLIGWENADARFDDARVDE